jgi:Fic family protein
MYKPIFTITNNLLKYISQIEAAKQIIENAPLVPAWERRFREEAEARTVHFSTKIEGNKLDLDEAKKIIEGEKVKTFRRRDVQEIINYREAIEHISKLKKKAIDIELILSVHKRAMNKILPSDELGKFRTCEEALISSKNYEVVFEPVEPEYIEGEVEGVLEWLDKESSEIHPVIKAGIILYELLRIHPFTDGNGRSVEENDEDLTGWLEFFVKGLAVELARIKDKVLGLSRDFKMRKNIGQVALNERQIGLINFMQEHGHIRNQDWQELFPDVSDDTVLRDLNDLKDKDIVKKEGRTKAARYVLR